MVTSFPLIDATSRLSLVYVKAPTLFDVGGVNRNGTSSYVLEIVGNTLSIGFAFATSNVALTLLLL